jgi:hypothetical protein
MCIRPHDKLYFHHGISRPQVVDGGTAFNMKGSCEDVAMYSRTADKETSVSLDLDEFVTAPRH